MTIKSSHRSKSTKLAKSVRGSFATGSGWSIDLKSEAGRHVVTWRRTGRGVYRSAEPRSLADAKALFGRWVAEASK